MRSIKVVGLAILAALALSALAAGQASATEYTYHVEGKALSGSKEITSSMQKEFTLKGKGVLNVESVTKCKKLHVEKGAVIEGGVPGKSKETVVFEECTATVGGAKCSGVAIENVPVINEIVTVVKPEKLKGQKATLFTPEKGEVFSKIKFKSCGLLGSPSAEITGTAAALDSPQSGEAVEGKLIYSAGESEITEVEKSGGAKKKVELDNEKTKKSTIEGEADVTLVSKEKWGVF